MAVQRSACPEGNGLHHRKESSRRGAVPRATHRSSGPCEASRSGPRCPLAGPRPVFGGGHCAGPRGAGTAAEAPQRSGRPTPSRFNTQRRCGRSHQSTARACHRPRKADGRVRVKRNRSGPSCASSSGRRFENHTVVIRTSSVQQPGPRRPLAETHPIVPSGETTFLIILRWKIGNNSWECGPKCHLSITINQP